jgi:hypothetical protein
MNTIAIEGLTNINSFAAVPIVVAIVQLFKMVGSNTVMTKFAPFISLGAGILIAFLTNGDTVGIGDNLLQGIIYGLSASGLYSGTKATAHAIKKEDPVNGEDDVI